MISRPYDDIQNRFQPVTEYFPQIHLRSEEENDQIHKEINRVVKAKVTELEKNLQLATDMQERLEKDLCEMTHRIYLWLDLAIDDIERTLKRSLRPDRETIPPLPKNVPEGYERILDRVAPGEKATVETILRIIVGARRLLTVQEMAMALGVATFRNAETATEAGLNPDRLGERIRQLCGLFVFIEDFKVYLIHQTAREFLLTKSDRSPSFKWYLEPYKTEVQMAEICVRYLLMDDLVSNDEESVRSLLEYSADNWADHFRDVLSPGYELVQWTWKLYNVATDRFRLWFPKFWVVAMPYREDPKMEALHLAAFNGHQEILSLVGINEEEVVDHVDKSETNALQWARVRGHLKIVQRLLEKGANVNAQGGEYGNALYAAVKGGHLDIVHQLLKKGADPNTQGGYYGNALQSAAQRGDPEIVQSLLENRADVNAQGGYFGNPLHAAAQGGQLKIVQRLLEKGADISGQCGNYSNALYIAAEEGHREIIQWLLEKGINVNSQGGHYGKKSFPTDHYTDTGRPKTNKDSSELIFRCVKLV